MSDSVWSPYLIAECICRSVVERTGLKILRAEESSSMKDCVISGITSSALPH